MTSPKDPKELKATSRVEEGMIKIIPNELLLNTLEDDPLLLEERKSIREEITGVIGDDSPIRVVDSLFTPNKEIDQIVVNAIAEDPVGREETFLGRLWAKIPANSDIRYRTDFFCRDLRAWWSPLADISELFRSASQKIKQGIVIKSYLDVLEQGSLEPYRYPKRLQPFARLSTMPVGEDELETNRLLSLKAAFFWQSDLIDELQAPRLAQRVIQAFAVGNGLMESISILFPDLDPVDFFMKNSGEVSCYPMFIKKLAELAACINATEIKSFVKYLETCFRTLTLEQFTAPMLNAQGGMSSYEILKEEAAVIYAESNMADNEFDYQRTETLQFSLLHKNLKYIPMQDHISQLAWMMPEWTTFRRELAFVEIEGILRYLSRPLNGQKKFHDFTDFNDLLMEYARSRKFSITIPTVDHENGLPMLKHYG